jgi:hypothetical protein
VLASQLPHQQAVLVTPRLAAHAFLPFDLLTRGHPDFESCFPAPTETGKDEDKDPCDLFAGQLAFLRDLIPEHKRRNSTPGIMGFMVEICEGYLADGRPPNFDHLLADLDELPAGPSPEA